MIISEIADPETPLSSAKFVEVNNAGSSRIDLSVETWYLSRQANGGTDWIDIQVSPSTTTTYVLTGTDASLCVNTDSITVVVNPAASLANIAGTISVCPGITGVQYWITNGNPTSTYTWTVNNGTIFSGQGTDTIAVDWSTSPGTGVVTVIF